MKFIGYNSQLRNKMCQNYVKAHHKCKLDINFNENKTDNIELNILFKLLRKENEVKTTANFKINLKAD